MTEDRPPTTEAHGDLRSVEAIEAQVAVAAGVLNAAHARLVELTASALASRAWDQSGVHTPQQWLAWKAGLTSAHARQVVDVARRSDELPALDRAVTEGVLSLDQAASVARRCPAGFDDDVVAVAVNATVPQIEKMLRRYAFQEPDARRPDVSPSPVGEKRDLSFSGDADGNWRLGLTLPPDEGAVVEAALVAKRDELFRRENPGVEADTPEGRAAQRELSWADAAVALAADSLAAGEVSYGGSVIDRFRAIVHLEADPIDPDRPPVAGLHLGAPLPDALRRYLLCDGDLLPVWERKGTPVAVGRTQRIVSPKLRKLVEHRDGGCRVPGCDRTRWLHVHHIIHWEDRGETAPENLVCLCQRHHRQHHLGLLPITGTADHLTVRDRHGRLLEPVGQPEPVPLAGDLTDEAEHRGFDPSDYVHPAGEPLQLKWIDFAPNTARPPEREPVGAGTGSRSP